jgi:hypothetical protein
LKNIYIGTEKKLLCNNGEVVTSCRAIMSHNPRLEGKVLVSTEMDSKILVGYLSLILTGLYQL